MAEANIHRPGIYAIRASDGRVYVGGSRDVAVRWGWHRSYLRAGTHNNAGLQAAWQQYGESEFDLVVLEWVEDEALLLEREQFWIDALKAADSGFNLCPRAGSSKGFKHSQKTCDLWSQIRKGQRSFLGRSHTPESRAAMSAAKRAAETTMRGEGHYKARLSADDVVEIRLRFGNGEAAESLGRRFQVTRQNIKAIVTRKSWRHVA